MPEQEGNSRCGLIRQNIFDALMSLMEHTDFKEITVTGIVKKAGVSRMAFYRNYDRVEEILSEYLEDNFVRYADTFSASCNENYTESLRIFFSFISNHSQLVKNLIAAGLTHLLLESFSHYLRAISRNFVCTRQLSPVIEKYSTEFIAGGIYRVVIEWVRDDMRESEKQMTELVEKILLPPDALFALCRTENSNLT